MATVLGVCFALLGAADCRKEQLSPSARTSGLDPQLPSGHFHAATKHFHPLSCDKSSPSELMAALSVLCLIPWAGLEVRHMFPCHSQPQCCALLICLPRSSIKVLSFPQLWFPHCDGNFFLREGKVPAATSALRAASGGLGRKIQVLHGGLKPSTSPPICAGSWARAKEVQGSNTFPCKSINRHYKRGCTSPAPHPSHQQSSAELGVGVRSLSAAPAKADTSHCVGQRHCSTL